MAAQGVFKQASSSHVDVVDSVLAPAAFPFSVEYRPLLDGVDGTYQTLEAMAKAVRGETGPDYSGYLDPYNQWAMVEICESYKGVATYRDITALWDFCAHSLKYVPHPINTQVVQDCRRTLEIGSGDCVSLSTCLATLLACRGHQSKFVAQFLDGEEASHVYVECEGMALDPVASDKPIGWRQPLDNNGFEIQFEIF